MQVGLDWIICHVACCSLQLGPMSVSQLVLESGLDFQFGETQRLISDLLPWAFTSSPPPIPIPISIPIPTFLDDGSVHEYLAGARWYHRSIQFQLRTPTPDSPTGSNVLISNYFLDLCNTYRYKYSYEYDMYPYFVCSYSYSYSAGP